MGVLPCCRRCRCSTLLFQPALGLEDPRLSESAGLVEFRAEPLRIPLDGRRFRPRLPRLCAPSTPPGPPPPAIRVVAGAAAIQPFQACHCTPGRLKVGRSINGHACPGRDEQQGPLSTRAPVH